MATGYKYIILFPHSQKNRIMRIYKIVVEDHVSFGPEEPRFTISMTATNVASDYQGESIITKYSDYAFNLSTGTGDKRQELEVHAVSHRRAMHLILILKGLAPYAEGIGNGLSRAKLIDQKEAYCLFKLNVIHERD